MTETFPTVDFLALGREEGVDLEDAFARLGALYQEVDARNEKNTSALALPCHRGCDMCCHESVFLTPLEFFYQWQWAQQHLDAKERDQIISMALTLYAEHQDCIEALNAPPPHGERDHFSLARDLKFRCPLLGAEGACRVYPVREMVARLFGCSFNDAGGVYGCHLVAAHLGGRQVTLVPARPTVRRLNDLPLTQSRQVYPYYFHLLFGKGAAR